jgi:hypothetical protein
MAAYWLSVVGLLILAYYSLYVYGFQISLPELGRAWATGLARAASADGGFSLHQ